VTWSPRRRYSAVAVFSDDLERVVLIHKLKPVWQAGKANFPGGKVEVKDWWPDVDHAKLREFDVLDAHTKCAARELTEETGLVVPAASLTLFCTLRFRSREGDDAECQFFCCRSDVDSAKTMESERVFVTDADVVAMGHAVACDFQVIPTMSNLPWLTAMARQTLRGDGSDSTPPFVVYEAGAHK
jgi:8-oxo-dGTP pyrophosphatase MutT (NUDIX family)